jgi:HPt (histidine-containing phosphotransfer) domain-containing protein
MVDRERLRELREEIGDEDFADVVAMFLDEMSESLATLCADPGKVGADALHGLKGSALNLGFSDFATACSQAEKKVAEGQPVDMVHLDWLFRESLRSLGPDLPAQAA